MLFKIENLGPQGPYNGPQRGPLLVKTIFKLNIIPRLGLLRSFQLFESAALLLNLTYLKVDLWSLINFLTLFSNFGFVYPISPVAPSNSQIAQLLLYSAIIVYFDPLRLIDINFCDTLVNHLQKSDKSSGFSGIKTSTFDIFCLINT